MKNTYTAPEAEIIIFENEDIMTASQLEVQKEGTIISIDWGTLG